jgi:transcriptional regulator with GAF, ATPase, and Fis domain
VESSDDAIGKTAQGVITSSATAPDLRLDLLGCLAALGQSLNGSFDPRRSLTKFSACVQHLLPHDSIVIARRENDGRCFSIFAEYGLRGAVLGDGDHYTTAFARGDRVPADLFALAPVFEGDVQLIADMATDARFGADAVLRVRMAEAGLQGRLAVPVHAGGHVAGALVVMSPTAGIYTEAHVSAGRQIADLIGPFVETVVALHRERRRRERLNAATALPAILGASLTVREVLDRFGEAVRPLVDFETMDLRLLAATGQGFESIGRIAASTPVHPRTATIKDYSFAERLSRGEMVLIRDAPRELDPRCPGDRLIIESDDDRSILGVPLLFGERVGGALFFASPRVSWYDESDVEVAGAIGAALVLAVQHERLAAQQQRLGAVEAKAQDLERQVASLRCALDERFSFDAIIGEAPKFIAAVEDARKVAATATTVLLTGESGTGKEVLARAIHQASARVGGPFVAVNCAALPETLLESELFGHERGAFTGADRLKRGRFELAAGGTLFLDEVGDLAPAVQGKLLRVLQERRYERLGGTTTLTADVRLIAATNRDLEHAVAEGRFREDLYYRLAVFRVHLPALRERGEDVVPLAEQFVRELGARMGKGRAGLSREARDALLAHSWPGNIRELQNAIERALIRAGDELISAENLGIMAPRDLNKTAAPASRTEAASNVHTLADQERQMIAEALRRTKGNKTRAATLLGLTRTQLLRRVRRFGLSI